MMLERLRCLNLNHLVVLEVLLREVNVTRAAKQLGLTQSATSHALGALRQTFDDELLVRTNKGMVLTERARKIAPLLTQALEQLSRSISDGGEDFDPSTATGTFSLATADFLLARIGTQLAVDISSRAPNVTVCFQQVSVGSISETILSREADFVVGPAMAKEAGVACAPLAKEPFVCAIWKDHPQHSKSGLSSNTSMSLETYCSLGHILISPSRRGTALVDQVFGTMGLSRHVSVRVESFLAAAHVLVGSPWILTAPRSAFDVLPEGTVALFDLPFELSPLELQLYWESSRAATARLQWFMGWVQAAFVRQDS